jgi:hypothetical protein
MLQSKELLYLTEMPKWSDISLPLYKEFSLEYLIPNIFRYYLENNIVLDVCFTEWGIYHIMGIQHLDGKISKSDFFNAIDNGLDFEYFTNDYKRKKRFNDLKHRIRMFGCIYQIMRNENMFYVPDQHLTNKSVIVDYIKYALVENKGSNVGIRLIDGKYVAYTLLVDRGINPTATIDGLIQINIKKLEIIRNNIVIDCVEY